MTALRERALEAYANAQAAAEMRETQQREEQEQWETDNFADLLAEIIGVDPLEQRIIRADLISPMHTVIDGVHIALFWPGLRLYAYEPCAACGRETNQLPLTGNGWLSALGVWLATLDAATPFLCHACRPKAPSVPPPPTAPPPLEEQLVQIIREIVREEVGLA